MRMMKILGAGIAALALTVGAASAQMKKITIATEGAYAPWNFTEAGGKLAGFEIDLAADLCKRAKLECTIIAQDWDGIIPALTAKKYDAIMAGMNITDKRLETINFSVPYASGPHSLVVMKGSPLEKLAGGARFNLGKDEAAAKAALEAMKPLLKGKTIGAQVSTINATFVQTFFKDVATVTEYKTTEQHDLDLAAGRLDAIFVAQSAALASREKAEFKDFTLVGPGFSGGLLGRGVAVGLRKEDADLKKAFDEAIAAALADGSVKALSMKWFKTDMSPQ